MRWLPKLLGVVLALSVPLTATADPPAIDKAKAALSLAKASREREEAKALAAGKCYDNHAAATAAASTSGRPLVLWVGVKCEECPEMRKKLGEAVHCHLETWNGDSTPRVVFSAGGQVWQYGRDQLGGPAAAEIRRMTGLPEKASQ